ncbi:MAG: hypothetical protein DMG97_12235 [Acidobacteria bacterium]|nr:MAG: hypothetical protein DMG96_28760 [Acidobacteriota bacterium]PYV73006.1 MAG: hypothetical protein DMG97_12235 [Acidobacteriota bacterium]
MLQQFEVERPAGNHVSGTFLTISVCVERLPVTFSVSGLASRKAALSGYTSVAFRLVAALPNKRAVGVSFASPDKVVYV